MILFGHDCAQEGVTYSPYMTRSNYFNIFERIGLYNIEFQNSEILMVIPMCLSQVQHAGLLLTSGRAENDSRGLSIVEEGNGQDSRWDRYIFT